MAVAIEPAGQSARVGPVMRELRVRQAVIDCVWAYARAEHRGDTSDQ